MNSQDIESIISQWNKDGGFSGVVSVYSGNKPVLEQAYGFANRSDKIPNAVDTRFAIASGTKILTAAAICRLVDDGLLSFDTPLKECLDLDFPNYHPGITIHHLLTHSSGITSYFEEDVNPDYEALWKEVPMYRMRAPRDFLPLFRHKQMKFEPGERYDYNDGGYILLGLVIEAVSGMGYREFVTERIMRPAGMVDSGFFATDRLPPRTAHGYIRVPEDDSWRTNIFAVPVVGGSDGGVYATAADIASFWHKLLGSELLSESMTGKMLSPCIEAKGEGEDVFYGYGVFIQKRRDDILAYFICGEDPGVSFLSAVYPGHDMALTVLANANARVGALFRELSAYVQPED